MQYTQRNQNRGHPGKPGIGFSLAVALAAAVLAGCAAAPRMLPPSGAAVPGSAPGPARGTGNYVWSPQMAAASGQLHSGFGSRGFELSRTTDDRLWVIVSGDSFEAGRSAVKPGAGPALDRVAAAIQSRPTLEVRVVGHTDARGDALANDALSLDRAASVRDWMVMRGVAATRFQVAGRGSREPVASNDTESGRASNRRVEILIGEPGSR